VPAFYLKRWADDGKLRVTNVDEGKVLGHDTEERRDRDGLLPSCAVLRGQGCTLREITPERYHLTFKAFYADEGRIPVRPV
jgi:hypothetical protein